MNCPSHSQQRLFFCGFPDRMYCKPIQPLVTHICSAAPTLSGLLSTRLNRGEPPFDGSVRRVCYAKGKNGVAHFNAQFLTVEVFPNVQCPEAATTGQQIGHKSIDQVTLALPGIVCGFGFQRTAVFLTRCAVSIRACDRFTGRAVVSCETFDILRLNKTKAEVPGPIRCR